MNNSETMNAVLRSINDPSAPLIEAALWLATDAYPDLDVAEYIRRLDAMADDLLQRLGSDANTIDKLTAVNEYLFEEQGFKGNMDDYYDPRNSYLNEVLDRRTGIPITLSLLYMELGRRLDLPMAGLSFPGHFLVMCDVDDGHVVLDPFSAGVSLSEEELHHRLYSVVGDQAASQISLENMLQPADNRDILVRLLQNLKMVYLKEEKYPQVLSLLDRILLLDPTLIRDLRDRGLVYAELDCFRPALADLQRYLTERPNAADALKIREKIIDLQQRVMSLN